MNPDKRNAIVVGILILVAYSMVGTNDPNAKGLGMFLEVISGIAVIGIATIMYPYFKNYGRIQSIFYFGLKGIEGLLMIIAGVLFFIHETSLLDLRDFIYDIHGYIFAVPALLFYYLLYKSKLIPNWLSLWGGIASVLLILVNIFELLQVIPVNELFYLPIVLNEIVLAIWLIVKGFDLTVLRELHSSD